MERHDIVSSRLFRASGPYSHVVSVNGADTLVFTSTMAALDEDWNVVGHDIRSQTRKTIENMKTALAEVGATIRDVVKVTWYLTNINDMAAVSEVREELFEGNRPASSSIPINALVIPELLLEADAIAVLRCQP